MSPSKSSTAPTPAEASAVDLTDAYKPLGISVLSAMASLRKETPVKKPAHLSDQPAETFSSD